MRKLIIALGIILIVIASILVYFSTTMQNNAINYKELFPKNLYGLTLNSTNNESGYTKILNYSTFLNYYYARYSNTSNNITIIIFNVSSRKVACMLFNNFYTKIKQNATYVNKSNYLGVNQEENFYFSNGVEVEILQGKTLILIYNSYTTHTKLNLTLDIAKHLLRFFPSN
ncbi:hypothetical protein [Candidatus Acidianus copahuensis]|nr:hypothetical protein [Candidatus Acidianus copahuensis]